MEAAAWKSQIAAALVEARPLPESTAQASVPSVKAPDSRRRTPWGAPGRADPGLGTMFKTMFNQAKWSDRKLLKQSFLSGDYGCCAVVASLDEVGQSRKASSVMISGDLPRCARHASDKASASRRTWSLQPTEL